MVTSCEEEEAKVHKQPHRYCRPSCSSPRLPPPEAEQADQPGPSSLSLARARASLQSLQATGLPTVPHTDHTQLTSVRLNHRQRSCQAVRREQDTSSSYSSSISQHFWRTTRISSSMSEDCPLKLSSRAASHSRHSGCHSTVPMFDALQWLASLTRDWRRFWILLCQNMRRSQCDGCCSGASAGGGGGVIQL